MSELQTRYEALSEKVHRLQRDTALGKLCTVIDVEPDGMRPIRRSVPLPVEEAREMMIEAYSLLETQDLSEEDHDRVGDWCDSLCDHAGMVNGYEVRAWLGMGPPETPA